MNNYCRYGRKKKQIIGIPSGILLDIIEVDEYNNISIGRLAGLYSVP